MKIGNIEVPDNKLLIIGFSNTTQEEVEKIKTTITKARSSQASFVFCNYTFRKVSETDKVIIVNASTK